MKNIYLLLLVFLSTFSTSVAQTKYNVLEEAVELRSNGNFFEAIKKLNSWSSVEPEILILKGDIYLESKQFENAVKVLTQLKTLNYRATLVGINRSYALFMSNEVNEAFDEAKDTWTKDPKNSNAVINYFNAHLWKNKPRKALEFLRSNKANLDEKTVLLLHARASINSGNFQRGIKQYEALVETTQNLIYFNEYLEVLKGKNQLERLNEIRIGEDIKNELGGVFAKTDSLEKENNFGVSTSYFKDIARNQNLSHSVWLRSQLSKKYTSRFGISHSLFSNTTGIKVRDNSVQATITESWNPLFSGSTNIRLSHIDLGEKQTSTLTGKQSFMYQPHDRRFFGLQLGRDILNFTPELFQKQISINTIGFTGHYMPFSQFGIYSQINRGWLNDKNSKKDIFLSAYSIVNRKPLVKIGFNRTQLSFEEMSTEYFSPRSYLNNELFIDVNGNLEKMKLSYSFQGGLGFQRINNGDRELATRISFNLSKNYKKLTSSLKFETSNIASNVGAGYKYILTSLNLSYKL